MCWEHPRSATVTHVVWLADISADFSALEAANGVAAMLDVPRLLEV